MQPIPHSLIVCIITVRAIDAAKQGIVLAVFVPVCVSCVCLRLRIINEKLLIMGSHFLVVRTG